MDSPTICLAFLSALLLAGSALSQSPIPSPSASPTISPTPTAAPIPVPVPHTPSPTPPAATPSSSPASSPPTPPSPSIGKVPALAPSDTPNHASTLKLAGSGISLIMATSLLLV